MYRIEVAPGEEAVFRTIEELAVGIRNGVVTPRARIYHHASEKWLPIGLHPHYKKALDMPAASAPHAPVSSTAPIPTSSRSKAHRPSHPQPQSVVHYPEPKHSPEPRPTPEPHAAPKAAAAPKIPAPVQSPVIAMQNEVLRDLPVISIPEPLPWNVKGSQAVAQPVEARAPVTHPPIKHPPITRAPVTHAPVTHAPVTHAPITHAPITHAPITYAPITHAPVTHAPATHAPATHAPEPYRPEPYRSMEYVPPVEDRHNAHADELPLPRPTARRSRRMGGRPLLLLGAAASLVVGTHLVLTATPAASVNPSEAPASVAVDAEPESTTEAPAPEAGQPAAGTSSAETRVTDAPRVTIAPARVRMTPGPAFAASVPARPDADSAGMPKSTTRAPAPAATPAEPSIAPAPGAMELAVPGILPESVVPTARTGDTMGMKKLLRALNGAKPAEGSAAP
jgi:hypothetical protein